jgi:hypothetical protein
VPVYSDPAKRPREILCDSKEVALALKKRMIEAVMEGVQNANNNSGNLA